MSLRIEAVEHASQWPAFKDAFRDLSTRLGEPNVFYSHALLGAALTHLKPDGLTILLTFEGQRLIGVLPIETTHSWRRVPLRTARLWRHIHCFNCTPLMALGCEDSVVDCAVGWLQAHGYALFECAHISLDSPASRALRRATRPFELEAHRRALFVPSPVDFDAFLRMAVPKRAHHRKWRRRRRALEHEGPLTFALERSTASTQSFLDLEASGWKGRSGTAIALRPTELAFFRAAATAAAQSGQLEVRTLRLGDRPIASDVTFTHATAGFSFKVAYDETYKRFSPGVILELDTLKQRLSAGDLAWVDSCAMPDHPMIDRLWPHRRRMGGVLMGINRLGRVFVRSAPALQRLQRKARQG